MKIRHVLFVCSGNTCRSPMAAALFEKLWRLEAGGWDLQVKSAGTSALPGFQATNHGIAAMERRQIDLSEHRSTSVSEQLLWDADLILTMTKSHKDSICRIWPHVGQRVFTMMEYIGQDGDVIDPFGGTAEHYELTASHLEQLLGPIITRIRREGTSR